MMNSEKRESDVLKKTTALIIFILIIQNISAYTWQNVSIMGGGFVPGLAYSPVQQGLIYARTDVGGIYRWNNSTSQWVPLTDMFGPAQGGNFGGESIAPDPVNPNVVYAAVGMSAYGTILSSTNQGNSWIANPIPVSIAANNDGREAGERLAVDPNLNSKLYFGSRWQGLWVSTNSAAGWSQVTSFPVTGDAGYGISWVIFPPPTGGYGHPSGSASTTIYAGVLAMSSGNSNIYYSTNAGANWNLVSGGPSNMVTPHASLGTDGNLWIVYDSGGYGPNGASTGQIWKLNTSTLGGTPAWANVTPSNGPPVNYGGYAGISVDPKNANHAVVTTIDWWSGPDKLLSTVNGGTSWNIIALAGSTYSSFNDNGAVYTLACGSTPGGTGWAGCVAIDPFNSSNAIYPSGGAAPGGGVWSSTNIQANPVAWTFTDTGLEEGVCIFMNPSAAGGILFSCMGDFGGMRHTNPAQSPASGMYCNPQFSNTNMLDFAENNTGDVVRVGNSGAVNSDIAYSTNNGQTWTPWGGAPSDYTSYNNMGSVAVSANGSRVVVAPYSGKGTPSYASSLGGAWTKCTGLPSGACVASDRVNSSNFYATYPANWVYGGTVAVYESTDGGASFSQVNSIPVNWSDANGNGQFVIPRPVFGVSGEFWVCTYNALYRFTNGGSSVTTISNVYEPFGVGFGKAASGQSHPAVYLSGTVNGTYGFYRCDDGAGTSWTRINDDSHQFSGAGWIEGDEAVYGRCYIGAGARGILYCDSAAVATATPTPAITSTYTRTATMTMTKTFTATFSVTSTYSRTITPTFTATMTQTYYTHTLTPSGTFTATATPTETKTFTWTDTPSFTPTQTHSITDTPTAGNSSTPAATNTATSTWTAESTAALTFTPTQTYSITDTPTVGDSSTSTITNTASSTWTAESTAALTFTPTQTYSITDTPTAGDSPAFTVTNTATSTCTSGSTQSFTVTPTGTETNVFTYTATATITQSCTETSIPTNTRTFTMTTTLTPEITVTDTAIPTKTITPSFTLTLTMTVTVAMTPTFTPTAIETGEIVYPNPYDPSKGDLNIIYNVSDSSDTIKVRFYTRAFRLILEESLYPAAAGINKGGISAGLMNGFANGVYFYSVFSSDKNGEKHGIINKVIILR
jgi:hypothetical protein